MSDETSCPDPATRIRLELGEISEPRASELRRHVAHCGMGLIFEAEAVHSARRVALKVIRPAQSETERARQRFLKEARAVAALTHDYIVTIYQVGEDNDVLFLAMQLLQGESLAERL